MVVVFPSLNVALEVLSDMDLVLHWEHFFRTELCNQLHEIHQHELYNVEMSKNADSRVIDWVRHLHSPSASEGTENTDCVSEP
jgi:hypothetical protein